MFSQVCNIPAVITRVRKWKLVLSAKKDRRVSDAFH